MGKQGGNIIKKILITDKKYPEKLRKIKKPPKQLYYEGNIDLLSTNIISIVGSRSCTENGIKLARKFASELAIQGITIASGLAVGIDTIAHKSTLEAEGKTIAVLGNGLNCLFPEENKQLYTQIINEGGLAISEYEPERKAESQYFLERNRIVSGISLGVLVIEAAHRSGTSVTAKLAQEQGRKVFVLPHEISDIHGVGTNRLIKKGANLITSTREIINAFEFLTYNEALEKASNSKEEKATERRKKGDNLSKEKLADEIQKEKNSSNKKLTEEITNEILKKLGEEYKEIYKIIADKETSINEIYLKTNKPITKINEILFNLEIEGYVEKIAGGYRCI